MERWTQFISVTVLSPRFILKNSFVCRFFPYFKFCRVPIGHGVATSIESIEVNTIYLYFSISVIKLNKNDKYDLGA